MIVTSFSELHLALESFQNDKRWLFRGHADASWVLVPKAGRGAFATVSDRMVFEAWKRRAIEFISIKPSDDWDWLAIAQHHGLATRLLDWSMNPLNAAFFAVRSDRPTDSVIVAVKPKNYTNCDEQKPMDVAHVSLFRPRAVVPRIVRQGGVFTIHPNPTGSLRPSRTDQRAAPLVPSPVASGSFPRTFGPALTQGASNQALTMPESAPRSRKVQGNSISASIQKSRTQLKKRGISYWLDEGEISWGDKIGARINEGLANSRYVVVFLTEAFCGRNWAAAELSAALSRENSEGRTVVLPVVVGETKSILKAYPLLQDKSFVLWESGIEKIADHLENRLFITTARDIVLPIKDTGNTVTISPATLVDLLEGIDGGHEFLWPQQLCQDLRKCGFLADAVPGSGVIVNGYSVPISQGDWGLPGIRDLHILRLLHKLLTGTDATRKFFGRGWSYRGIVRDLVAAMKHLQESPLPVPATPQNIQGRWLDSKTVCLYWSSCSHAECYSVLRGDQPDVSAMKVVVTASDCVAEIDLSLEDGEQFFAVRSVNRSGEASSEPVSSPEFASSEEEWAANRKLNLDDVEAWHAWKLQDGWEDLGW